MNMKINTICFILLFFILISAVNAVDSDNETLQKTNPSDEDICQVAQYEAEKLEANIESSERLEESISNLDKLEATNLQEKQSVGVITKLVKQKVTIKAPNIKMHYKDGSKFTVTVKDKNKHAIKKAKIKININGKTYTKTTDSKGKASLDLNFKSGTYTATTTFDETSFYKKQSAKSTITIKSTIKCNDFTKYYKNTAAYYSTYYDKKGKILKNTAVKFKLNSKTYSVKTNSKGVAKLTIDQKPGKYSISSINSKTSETVIKTITIKSLIETKDLTMNDGDASNFIVKILDSNGKVSPNKKVTIKTNGNTYTLKTDSKGIAALPIDFDIGKYTVTTEYEGLKNTNQITINKVIKKTPFSHVTLIPNYVNVTIPYVFHNSAYSLKTGFDGIVKMPKNEIFIVQLSPTKGYLFTQDKVAGLDSIPIGYKTHLVPFDGSEVKSDYNKDNLKGDGILISRITNYTQIEFRSTTQDNTEFFGLYMDGGLDNDEILTYIQNNNIKAKINFFTYSYDELGLRYSLSKYYGKTIYDFNYMTYDEITNHNADKIKFVNNNKPANLDFMGIGLAEYMPSEDIITKFNVNGVEELEKKERITYGFGDKFRRTYGFEIVQSYAIINEKITQNIMKEWIVKCKENLIKFGITHVCGMFIAGLETAWLADEMADQFAKEYNVGWKRGNTATILGGINLEDTYLHILNADMGMKVTENNKNAELFMFANSLNLPNIEEYVLEPVSQGYNNNTTNSLDNVLLSVANNNYSIAQLGNTIYLFDGNNSAIVLNTQSGVSNVLISSDDTVYKGSKVKTNNDCCSLCSISNTIVNTVNYIMAKFKSGLSPIFNAIDKLHPYSMLAYQGLKYVLGKTLTGTSSVALGLFTTMAMVQSAGVTYRTGTVDEKDWHSMMDTYTFTRSGYLQGKKVYNIPNKNGGYDYVEVPINFDLSLDRNNVKYISQSQTKILSKEETYQYFSDEYWSPFSMPTKYWDKSWKNL